MVTFADMFTYTLVLIALCHSDRYDHNAQEITAHQAVSGVSFKLQTCTGRPPLQWQPFLLALFYRREPLLSTHLTGRLFCCPERSDT